VHGPDRSNFRKSRVGPRDINWVCPEVQRIHSGLPLIIQYPSPISIWSHASATCIAAANANAAATTPLRRPVHPLTSSSLLYSPNAYFGAYRFLESQLTLAGKDYGLMYSIWARFRDVIGEGPGLIDCNPSHLSIRQVQLSDLTSDNLLMAVSSQRPRLLAGVP
jgi:hypothetical protein